MVKSMTGYGRAVETVNGREFTVEVRSVNNRYLDCTVKLPRGLSFGEDAVKQAVKATISRGKVDVFVSVRSEGAQDTAVSLNKPMVEGYLAALKQLQADYGVTGEITVSMLAGLPDVFLLDKPQVDEAQLLADFLSVAEKALASFDAMRTTEGAALAEDLRSRGETILSLVSQVEAGSPQTVADYRARLEAKLQEVLANTSIDESRILTEAAIFAELEGLKNGPITQEEVDDCRRGLLSSMDALGDSLAALENWYYGQITRGEPLYPPEYGKVLTGAVSLDEVRQTLQSYHYSVCYAVTAEPGTQGKGGSEDVE